MRPLSYIQITTPIEQETPQIGQWVSYRGELFRVNDTQTTYGINASVRTMANHAICTLDDNYIPADIEMKNATYKSSIEKLLEYQKTVYWKLGTIPSGIASKTISYTIKPGTVLDGILALMDSLHEDYYLAFDWNTSPWTFSIAKTASTPSCECRLNRNLKSCTVKIDRSDMRTELVLPDYGKKNGKKVSEDKMMRIRKNTGKWGYVTGEYTDDSAADDATLLSNAQAYLDQVCQPIITITLDALDISEMTGQAIDTFRIGSMCRVALPNYGFSSDEKITGISYRDVIGKPEAVVLTLANRVKNLSTGLAAIQKKASGGGSAARNALDGLNLEKYERKQQTEEVRDVTNGNM